MRSKGSARKAQPGRHLDLPKSSVGQGKEIARGLAAWEQTGRCERCGRDVFLHQLSRLSVRCEESESLVAAFSGQACFVCRVVIVAAVGGQLLDQAKPLCSCQAAHSRPCCHEKQGLQMGSSLPESAPCSQTNQEETA